MGHAKLGRVPDRFFFMTAADDRCTVYMKVDIGTSCTKLIFRKRVSQLSTRAQERRQNAARYTPELHQRTSICAANCRCFDEGIKSKQIIVQTTHK